MCLHMHYIFFQISDHIYALYILAILKLYIICIFAFCFVDCNVYSQRNFANESCIIISKTRTRTDLMIDFETILCLLFCDFPAAYAFTCYSYEKNCQPYQFSQRKLLMKIISNYSASPSACIVHYSLIIFRKVLKKNMDEMI